MRRPLWPLAGCLIGLLGLWLFASFAHAQAVSPNSGLAQMYQGLSPEEQQAIMNGLGTGNLGNGTSAIGTQAQLSMQNQAQLQQYEQQMAVRQKQQEQEQQSLIPIMKGGDWIIVEIAFSLPRRAASQSALALQQAYAEQGAGAGAGAGAALSSSEALQALKALQGGSAGGAAAALAQASTAVTPASQLSGADKQRLTALMEIIRSRNPYQLSPNGDLMLPGFAPVPLAGLSEDQATLRLSVIPAFQNLEVRVTLLPLDKTGVAALKPFGYDLFSQYSTSFNPLTDVPVPSNYTVGPGDVLDVLLYGNKSEEYQLAVGRGGRVSFPQLGPINVGGQLFSTVQAEIEARVAHQMIGVRASVTMEQTRSIQVFVVGDAFEPGAYTISSLGTITSALYAAGGIGQTGSMRRIELKRDGVLVRTLDLYDLLLRGSTRDDAKLLQGDVVFVPPVGPTVAIDDQVERPAIYEIKNETTPAQIVALAGGLKPDADTSRATLTRIMPNGQRVVLPLDLTAEGGEAEGLRNGDYIHIPRLRPTLDADVVLQGNIYTAGPFEYHPEMRLSTVIPSVEDLKPDSDLHYVLIRREVPPDRRIEVLSADLAAALARPGTAADPVLMPRDQITVFDLSSSRDRIIQPILEELRSQSTAERPDPVVIVEGRVNVPGQYPLGPGMRVADLVRAGGGLASSAYTTTAELTRYVVDAEGTRRTQIFDIDLARALAGDQAANVRLEPYDVLSVKEVSQWANRASVTLLGEVRFPGVYTVKPGETLKSVLERAGGLTQYAFPQGAVFTRTELQQREQKQMDQLAARMKIELGVLALRAVATAQGANVGGATNSLIIGRSLLHELEGEKAVGRLVIDLRQILRNPPNSIYDIVLRDGDQLIVPKFQQEVSVIGEVQDPTSHLYNPNLSRNDYIRLSGGFTAQADEKRLYVVRANGSVIASGGSRWFDGGGNIQIRRGDTIVVPINATQMLPLPFWQAVTGIMYNVAIAAAAVHALGP
ncbi:MAG: SLBB domain-containing protein [Steroidobacteraceae bacterium]